MKKNIKVIKIINENRIVLNCGSEDGITLEDLFDIYVVTGDPIIDIDTGETLGTLKYIKATVRPSYIDEKFCVCINSKYISGGITYLGEAINKLNDTFSTPVALDVNAEDISGGYEDIKDKSIHVGDLARKL